MLNPEKETEAKWVLANTLNYEIEIAQRCEKISILQAYLPENIGYWKLSRNSMFSFVVDWGQKPMFIEKSVSDWACEILSQQMKTNLNQTYKEGSARIRCKQILNKSPKYLFTFKIRTEDGANCEIETEISKYYFERILKVCTARLEKIRYELPQLEELKDFKPWEIDFFKNGNETYFVMAELETSEDQTVPDLPAIMQNNLLFAVPKQDMRFSSYQMTNIKESRILYESLAQANVYHV